ncbi:hypothetical protein [Martelella mangrovi]|uniref:Uncharacterized protein n=1 Tax=Martelella mangrovi TaxID=1397477 RepID=A0ABV2ICA2_9HYPH|nr:hypothetical protein [uncultured Martelella sp.]
MLKLLRPVSGDVSLAPRAGSRVCASGILIKTAKKTTTKIV